MAHEAMLLPGGILYCGDCRSSYPCHEAATSERRALIAAVRHQDARLICSLCAKGTPHRMLPESSIGGPRTRVVRDLHEVDDASGIGIQECVAFPIWQKIDEEAKA